MAPQANAGKPKRKRVRKRRDVSSGSSSSSSSDSEVEAPVLPPKLPTPSASSSSSEASSSSSEESSDDGRGRRRGKGKAAASTPNGTAANAAAASKASARRPYPSRSPSPATFNPANLPLGQTPFPLLKDLADGPILNGFVPGDAGFAGVGAGAEVEGAEEKAREEKFGEWWRARLVSEFETELGGLAAVGSLSLSLSLLLTLVWYEGTWSDSPATRPPPHLAHLPLHSPHDVLLARRFCQVDLAARPRDGDRPARGVGSRGRGRGVGQGDGWGRGRCRGGGGGGDDGYGEGGGGGDGGRRVIRAAWCIRSSAALVLKTYGGVICSSELLRGVSAGSNPRTRSPLRDLTSLLDSYCPSPFICAGV